MNYYLQSKEINGTPKTIHIFNSKKKKAIGYALVFIEDDECLLWHIEIDKKYRRKKAATGIISFLKGGFNYIVTAHTTEEGKKLCLKNDFFEEKTPNNNILLVWRNNYAINEKREEDQEKDD